jgi:hypothetical protein
MIAAKPNPRAHLTRPTSRPASRFAKRKLVPGFLRSVPRARTWSRCSQVADLHQGNRLHRYESASGCVVAPNKTEEKKDWKLSKESCAELAKKYSKFYNAKPGETRFDDSQSAAIAAMIVAGVMRDTVSPEFEYGGSVYRETEMSVASFGRGIPVYGIAQTSYLFTEPTRGNRDNWGGFDAFRTWFKDNVAFYHTHTLLPGEDPASSGRTFSYADYRMAQRTEEPVYMLSPQNAMTWEQGKYGYNGWGEGGVPGAPSEAEVGQIIQCKTAGY